MSYDKSIQGMFQQPTRASTWDLIQNRSYNNIEILDPPRRGLKRISNNILASVGNPRFLPMNMMYHNTRGTKDTPDVGWFYRYMELLYKFLQDEKWEHIRGVRRGRHVMVSDQGKLVIVDRSQKKPFEYVTEGFTFREGKSLSGFDLTWDEESNYAPDGRHTGQTYGEIYPAKVVMEAHGGIPYLPEGTHYYRKDPSEHNNSIDNLVAILPPHLRMDISNGPLPSNSIDDEDWSDHCFQSHIVGEGLFQDG